MKLYTRPFLEEIDENLIEHYAQKINIKIKFKLPDGKINNEQYKIISKKVIRTPNFLTKKFHDNFNNKMFGHFGYDVVEIIVEFEKKGCEIMSINLIGFSSIATKNFMPNLFLPDKFFRIYVDASIMQSPNINDANTKNAYTLKNNATHNFKSEEKWNEINPFNLNKNIDEYSQQLPYLPKNIEQLKNGATTGFDDLKQKWENFIEDWQGIDLFELIEVSNDFETIQNFGDALQKNFSTKELDILVENTFFGLNDLGILKTKDVFNQPII